MRITTGMIQRNVLSDLNGLSEKLARTQAKASSGREITRPSDDPFGTAKAMGLRATLAANDQYVSNIQDAQGWQDSTESALDSITSYVNRANDLLVRGANDTADQTSRNAIASEIDQIIQGIKESANASYGDKYLMSGTATSVAPYKLGADDAYQGNEAGLDPAIPGVIREIGPGVTMSINTVAREILGDGRAAPADGKLLNTLRDIADHLRAGDGAALRGADMSGLKSQARLAARGPRAQRRDDEPARSREHAPEPDPGSGDEAALGDRGRRHRQDDHRVQLPERRLPGLAAGRREHRAVVANGFPPLGR